MVSSDLQETPELPPGTGFPRSSWKWRVIFYVLPLLLFGGLAAFCVKVSCMPWWVVVIGFAAGISLGAWGTIYGFDLSKERPRRLFFIILFSAYWFTSEFLAWITIPHGPHHSVFKMAFLFTISFGYYLAFIPPLLPGRQKHQP